MMKKRAWLCRISDWEHEYAGWKVSLMGGSGYKITSHEITGQSRNHWSVAKHHAAAGIWRRPATPSPTTQFLLMKSSIRLPATLHCGLSHHGASLVWAEVWWSLSHQWKSCLLDWWKLLTQRQRGQWCRAPGLVHWWNGSFVAVDLNFNFISIFISNFFISISILFNFNFISFQFSIFILILTLFQFLLSLQIQLQLQFSQTSILSNFNSLKLQFLF